MRVLIGHDPYRDGDAGKDWQGRGIWPCRWISCPAAGEPPFVTAYRHRFSLPEADQIRIHVSADERYELFLDGERVGRGSERGDVAHWFFETYDLDLAQGEHVIVARVWSLGDHAAFAQMSLRPGFLLAPQERRWIDLLGTGVAGWEAMPLRGYTFTSPLTAWGTGDNVIVDGAAFAWGFERGEGVAWASVVVGGEGSTASRNDRWPTQLLTPATLPPMLDAPRHGGSVRLVARIDSMTTHDVPVHAADNLPDEAPMWQRLIDGAGEAQIPPHTMRRVLVDLNDYVCAYPEVTVSGGAGSEVRVHWQESLYEDPRHSVKGNRDEIEGKRFVCVWNIKDGVGDTFRVEGGAHRRFDTLWWQCGRYIEVVVTTSDEPLTIERLTLRETRYPLEMEGAFEADDPRPGAVMPLMLRALQMCSHETYMDCPYFEQLMYVGDTRLEALTTYAVTRDDRLPRKALQMFWASRQLSGLTQSRYPTRVAQTIPNFSLWWVAMVHDYARWRDDPDFVRGLMPGVRGVLDYFLARRDSRGLILAADGWNYMDWVPSWDSGVPPDGADGVSGVSNWQIALVLGMAAELEAACGEPELGLRAERLAAELADRIIDTYWDEDRGLFADDPAHTRYSEHAQCLAILSHRLDGARQARVAQGLLEAPDLARTTIYFSHYLFETYGVIGRTDALLDRLALWFDLQANGLKTTVEMPEPTRSDCHAWGAHPLYHYQATLLGVRPDAMGFRTVRIAPQPGPLRRLRGALPHPAGRIEVDLRVEEDGLHAIVALPEGVEGVFVYDGRQVALRSGSQEIHWPSSPGPFSHAAGEGEGTS